MIHDESETTETLRWLETPVHTLQHGHSLIILYMYMHKYMYTVYVGT